MTKWQKEMFGSPSKGLSGYEVNDLNRLFSAPFLRSSWLTAREP